MSTDNSQAHEPDRDAVSIGDLNAKPISDEAAEQTRGGAGTKTTTTTSDIVVIKTTDSSSPKMF